MRGVLAMGALTWLGHAQEKDPCQNVHCVDERSMKKAALVTYSR